jgi:serine/threonine protein kinase
MIGARRLAGRYRLLHPLGEGGMGTVWLAADDVLRRDVAIKEVRLSPDLDEARRKEICAEAVREANVAAGLNHPSIVTVHDVVVEDGRPWLVMELLSGLSLERAVQQGGPLPPHQAARVGVGVLSALSVAHAAGVIHRDVKPSNIVLTRTGRAVLTDFGIAAFEGEATRDRTTNLVGSPAYIAPERLRGEPGCPASDLWSLGATLYFAVEGRPPHHADSAVAVLSKVLTEAPRPPERAGSLTTVLAGLLADEPGTRPGIPLLTKALTDLANGRTAVTPRYPLPPGWSEPPPAAPTSRWGSLPMPWMPQAASNSIDGWARARAAKRAEREAAAAAAAEAAAERPRRGRSRHSSLVRRAAVLVGAELALITTIVSGTVLAVNAAAPEQRPAAAPTPTRLSESPGAFSLPVDMCKLLSEDQVDQLLPKRDGAGKATADGGCEWLSRGKALSVRLAGTGKQWGTSPQQAHERFVNLRHGTVPTGQLAWSWPEIGAELRSARSTGPLPVTDVGQEAFRCDTYDNRNTGRLERSQITFRVSNLVVEVGYTAADGKPDAAAIQQGARTAATWTAQALSTKRTG